jgi:hypothetical protein
MLPPHLDAAPVALALGDDGLDLLEHGGRLVVPAVSALVKWRGGAAGVERGARRGEALDPMRAWYGGAACCGVASISVGASAQRVTGQVAWPSAKMDTEA